MKLKVLFLAVFAAVVVSVYGAPSQEVSPGAGAVSTGLLSPQVFRLARNAVFEVILEKPEEDSTVYEKELDWDIVPFAVRNDRYYSIGTAFAISNTELITAFHVINLAFESMVFDKYFVRDAQKNIYEVDQVTGASNEMDYLIFTVKGRTFDEYFEFERQYIIGEPVFSIGNALGEGIVIRNGLVLGTVPEEDSGRWNLLKSSADGNPGNSGGPLVTPDGKVVALVIALRENMLYSVPAEVILDGSRTELPVRNRFRFGHLILANNLNSVFETQVPLPDTYTAIRQKIREAYIPYYNTAMTTLFDQAPEYLTGPNNGFLLNSSLSSIFPEVSFVDPNDDNWKLSDLNRRSYMLEDDGRLIHASVSGMNFYKLKRPASVLAETVNTDPRYIMDIILQNIRAERTLWGNDRYRILSFGDPASVGSYEDSVGRTWITAYWLISHEDDVQIMFILPQPNGPTVVTTRQNSSLLQDYEWDLQKTCDHLYTAYDGTFEEWSDFLTHERFIPDILKDMRFVWNSEERQNFEFSNGPYSIRANNEVFDWDSKSELFLAPSWYRYNNQLEWGIRRIILYGDQRGREAVFFYRNVRPDARLGSNAMENWNDMALEKFPYDGAPVISARDNTGSIGAVLQARRPDPQTVFSLYLSMDDPISEDDLMSRFDALKEGVIIER
ncbi:MAG: serine protease [Treponema sp.]|nr:serine protease [Treponema sp.]